MSHNVIMGKNDAVSELLIFMAGISFYPLFDIWKE